MLSLHRKFSRFRDVKLTTGYMEVSPPTAILNTLHHHKNPMYTTEYVEVSPPTAILNIHHHHKKPVYTTEYVVTEKTQAKPGVQIWNREKNSRIICITNPCCAASYNCFYEAILLLDVSNNCTRSHFLPYCNPA